MHCILKHFYVLKLALPTTPEQDQVHLKCKRKLTHNKTNFKINSYGIKCLQCCQIIPHTVFIASSIFIFSCDEQLKK